MGVYDYMARTERVIDGDTIRLLIDHGMYLRSSNNIRLKDVWAPELSTGDAGRGARDAAARWLTHHLSCWGEDIPAFPLRVVTEKDRQTFNRYVGRVSCGQCGASLNEALRAIGYSSPLSP